MELLSGYASSSSTTSSCGSLAGNDQRSYACMDESANKRQQPNASQPIDKRPKFNSLQRDQDQFTKPNTVCVPKFERNLPHWEGRWTGHLCLPFPPLEQLDSSSNQEQMGESDDENAVDISCLGNKNRTSTHHEHLTDCDKVHRKGSDAIRCSDESSTGSSSCSGEEVDDIILQSRIFLPTARRLIRHWELIIQDFVIEGQSNNSTFGDDQVDGRKVPTIVVVPHIPMHPIGSTLIPTPVDKTMVTTTLHISLARPIYLPSASVDSFMTCIEKNVQAVLGIAGGGAKHAVQRQHGRILHFQPRNATIFTNDQQNRSFLSIPISKESSRWVKQSLLPPIDAAMVRFGLETYYHSSEGGEGCILHVSVASVKGNVIPQLLQQRGRNCDDDRSVRSLPLFIPEGEHELATGYFKYIPSSIPIRFDEIQCTFGKDKQMVIPF